MADTFSESVQQTSGSYAGDYLWSAAANWSAGLPTATSAVALSLGSSPSAVSTNVTVASVAYSTAGSLLIGGSLSAGSLTGTISGDALSVQSGGSLAVTGTLSLTSGTLDIAGNATIGSLGLKTMTVEGTATVGQIGGGTITVNRGGTLEVTTGTNSTLSGGSDQFNLSGGTLKLDSSVKLLSGSTFQFDPTATYGASSLYIGDLANFTYGALSNAFSGFDVGDSLLLGSANFSSVTYSVANHTLTLTGANSGPTYALTNFHFAGDVGAISFAVTTAANGGTLVTLNCFLAGTRIETPDGAVPIEALSEGDLVLTVEGARRVARPVRWVGSRDIDPIAMEMEAAIEAAPVRIRAHAFDDNIPARDLLVTADHCVFESQGLIPARMLVNGTSIVRESDRASYRIYHIEFETHSIVLSEGLTTESFLDTGGAARSLSTPAHPDAGNASWARNAAAPLTTTREAVEPVWRRLALRAEALGLGAAHPGTALPTTTDPALCVRLADGTILGARRQRGTRHFFVLPPGQSGAVLHSRSAVPACVEGPFVDDRRRLGVCVRSATLWTELRSTTLSPSLDGQPGWYPPETPHGACWTDGAGSFDLPVLTQPTILEIDVAGGHRYPLREDAALRRA